MLHLYTAYAVDARKWDSVGICRGGMRPNVDRRTQGLAGTSTVGRPSLADVGRRPGRQASEGPWVCPAAAQISGTGASNSVRQTPDPRRTDSIVKVANLRLDAAARSSPLNAGATPIAWHGDQVQGMRSRTTQPRVTPPRHHPPHYLLPAKSLRSFAPVRKRSGRWWSGANSPASSALVVGCWSIRTLW